jgi:hypothetical protein
VDLLFESNRGTSMQNATGRDTQLQDAVASIIASCATEPMEAWHSVGLAEQQGRQELSSGVVLRSTAGADDEVGVLQKLKSYETSSLHSTTVHPGSRQP